MSDMQEQDTELELYQYQQKDKVKDSYFISNRALLLTRVSFAIVTCAHIAWRISISRDTYFYFLTNWNLFINLVYFLTAVFLKSPSSRNPILVALFAIVQTLAWIVAIVYWALLFSPTVEAETLAAGIISHTINLIFPLLDLALNKITLKWVHSVYPIAFTVLYTVVAVIVHLISPRAWPYTFLEKINQQSDGINWGYSIAFLCAFEVIVIGFFCGVLGLVHLREQFANPNNTETRFSQQPTIVEMDQISIETP